MRKKLIYWVFLCFLALPAHSQESELRSLARVHKEIAHVLKLVEEIEGEVVIDPNALIRFRYDKLIQRLGKLQKDIKAHIDWVNSNPRTERFDVE